MRRKAPGHFAVHTTPGEAVRAYVPDPLPPKPPIRWDPALLKLQQLAAAAVGRLDGITALMPEPARRLLDVFNADRQRIQADPRMPASVLKVHHHFQTHPIASAKAVSAGECLTPATVGKALGHLERLGILKEITGGLRNRLFVYDQTLELLREGT